jgi:hypothetical protein
MEVTSIDKRSGLNSLSSREEVHRLVEERSMTTLSRAM